MDALAALILFHRSPGIVSFELPHQMGKSLNISLDIERSTLLSLGLSTAAHVAAVCAFASVVVTPHAGQRSSSANSRLVLDLPLATDETTPRPLPPPATPQDMERLLAKMPVAPPKPAELEDPEVRLGVDDGSNDTRTWVGFAQASEHHAQKSVVEQSALTQDSGNPGETAAPQEPQLAPRIADDQAASTGLKQPEAEERPAVEGVGQGEHGNGKDALDRPRREAREFVPAKNAAPGISAPQSTLSDVFAELIHRGASGTAGDADATRALRERIEASIEASAGTKAQQARPQTTPGVDGSQSDVQESKPSVAPTTGGDAKRPGIQDDREAEATSLTEPVDLVINGKVQAAKGLRIRTVQAEFATTTRLTARPRNPQVLITFNRAGKVVRAVFTPGRSTGSEDVDQPLLNSIYRWTARGETLLKLSASNPRAELTIIVNILFP